MLSRLVFVFLMVKFVKAIVYSAYPDLETREKKFHIGSKLLKCLEKIQIPPEQVNMPNPGTNTYDDTEQYVDPWYEDLCLIAYYQEKEWEEKHKHH